MFMLLVLVNQVCGMVIGKLKYEIHQNSKPYSYLKSAAYIILGAYISLTSPLITLGVLSFITKVLT